jgi:hypothetical protein
MAEEQVRSHLGPNKETMHNRDYERAHKPPSGLQPVTYGDGPGGLVCEPDQRPATRFKLHACAVLR